MKRISYVFIISILTFSIYSCNENIENMEEQKTAGIKLVDLDTTVNPETDFNMYANGGWMKNNPLPDDKSRYGSFDALADLGEKQVKDLILDLAAAENGIGTNAQKIGDFYSIGMDTAKIELDRAKPLENIFLEIQKIQNIEDLQDLISFLHTNNIFPLFQIYADADAKNSEMIIAQMTQGGIGMPDRDYYTESDERSKTLQKEYLKLITGMFILLEEEEQTANENAHIIFELETRLAKSSMTRLERRNPFATYNKISVEELQSLSPNIDWPVYFDNIGLSDPDSVNINQTDFFKEISNMIVDISIEDWKIYLKWNVINNAANYLSSDFVEQRFAFYGKVLSGSKENRPRWKRVINTTNSALSEAIGQLYVERYFPPEAKERMINLVTNLKTAYGERIKNLTWMTDSTKQKALEKLEKINVKVGYPDKWKDYSALDITKDSYLENVLNANRFAFNYMIGKMNKPVDKLEWHMPPQMVNAYYDPSMNEIVFPAAILQPPFFYLDADDAVNYGAIGVVIGHEMTHGFDDQGKNYDKNGNLNDWWSKEDLDRFNEKTKLLVDQYNSYYVLDTVAADGELTLGENIADLGGLNISYSALQNAIKGKELEKIDGFTPEQRFFLAYSHVWAQNIRDEEILRRTKEDVHSLGKWRVNGPLPNMPEFYEAFDISEESNMWIHKDKRALIW